MIWEIRDLPPSLGLGAGIVRSPSCPHPVLSFGRLIPSTTSPATSRLSCSCDFLIWLQIQYLDSMNGEDLLLTGEVSWRPLVEKNPQSILKPHSPTYNDEGL